MRELLAIEGLDKTSEMFRRKLIELSDRLALDPSMLAAVIAFESGFNPKARNPTSKATGLIQFMPDEPDKPGKPGRKGSASLLGTSIEALYDMSAERQLDYVEAYFKMIIDWKGPIETIEDHYLAVFAPAFIGRDPDTVIYAAPSQKYHQNDALDADQDGAINLTEATARVIALHEAAKARPPLFVDMTAEPPSNGIGIFGAALVVVASSWAFGRLKRVA